MKTFSFDTLIPDFTAKNPPKLPNNWPPVPATKCT